MSTTSAPPRLTLLYLLYNAENSVDRLVNHLAKQTISEGLTIEAWFVDDSSVDQTVLHLSEALRKHWGEIPSWIQIRRNPSNLGLAGSLNHSLAQIKSPFVMTCHVDCFFDSTHYLAEMVRLMEAHPQLAALTGRPVLDPPTQLSFTQKVNVIANLMDVLPPAPGCPEWTAVGFAEGRCDIFRMDALRSVGLYPRELRTSGEDQILAARLRSAGYTLGRANHLTYTLSTSTAQDTFIRLCRHLFLFGSTQPYILLRNRKTGVSLAQSTQSANRQARMRMRLLQLAMPLALFFALFGYSTAIVALGLLIIAKYVLWMPQYRMVQLTLLEAVGLFFGQFCLDCAYSLGVISGARKALKPASNPKEAP